MQRLPQRAIPGLLILLLTGLVCGCTGPRRAITKQQSLDEWRALTTSSAPAPRVFVKGDQVQFYFPTPGGLEAFKARWAKGRIPTKGYRVKSALLRWDQKLDELPEGHRAWREATVIAGAEWRALATNLIAELTPLTANHAAHYQAFLADGLCYRDAGGDPHLLPLNELPPNAALERQYSSEETLELLARSVDGQFARTHPRDTLFLLMPPTAKRFAQPILVDRLQRRCVLLNPAALYDYTERGVTAAAAFKELKSLLPESHGLALLKNPVSSAARLADLAVQTVVRFVRLPLPKPSASVAPLKPAPGMDLVQWESWLDRFTGTRLEDGSLQLRINGDGFFPGFEEALAQATNNIHLNIYIFDRDDVGVNVADRLKARSGEIEVKVLYDSMGSIGAGQVPPASPLPEDFTPPSSIGRYLAADSRVKVRKFLNPWLSSNHSKVLLVDGARAWLGGMNFGREYRYEWHDLMVEVHGPVVSSLETEFRRAWAHAGSLGDLAYAAELFAPSRPEPTPPASGPWIRVRRLPTRTAWKPFASAVLKALNQARSYVYVENPYLLDKRAILALVRARNRGVDVRVVLPGVNDFKAAGRANLVVANYLLQRGVRVFFYPGMTHAKAVMVDGWVCLGSSNLNHLSMRVNQEQNIATSDPLFAAEVRRTLFEEDFSRSHELAEPIAVDWVDVLANLLLEGI